MVTPRNAWLPTRCHGRSGKLSGNAAGIAEAMAAALPLIRFGFPPEARELELRLNTLPEILRFGFPPG